MTKIRLYSNYDFLIFGKDFEDEICDFCFFDIILEDNEKCNIRFFPTNNQESSLPFCLCFFMSNGSLVCKNNNVKIYKVLSHYEVFVFPLLLSTNQNCISKTLQSGKSACTINVWDNQIEFCLKQEKKRVDLAIKNPIFASINGNVIVVGDTNNQKMCVIFCTKTCETKTIFAEQIELSDEVLRVLENKKTCLEHKTLTTYTFAEDGPKSTNVELYSANREPLKANQQVVPELFLDAIKVGDENLAKTYLCENLQTTPLKTFREYFGEYQNLVLYSTTPTTLVLYYENNAKVFEFDIQNNVIVDITEI